MKTPSSFIKRSENLISMWRFCPLFVMSADNPRRFMSEASNFAEEAKQAYEDLLKNGKIVWGSLVQANVDIFEPGNQNLLASYIYSPENYFLDNPQHLLEISNRIFRLKGRKTGDELMDAAAERITDEHKDSFSYPIPYQLTDGHQVYLSSVLLMRSCLPEGRLTSRLMPMLVNPPDNGFILPLPLRFWSNPLQQCMAFGFPQKVEQGIWTTIWQTEKSPPQFQPLIGGERAEKEPDWVNDTLPIKISVKAHQLLRDYLIDARLLENGAVQVGEHAGQFFLKLIHRNENELGGSLMLEDVMYCFSSDQFSEKDGMSIDYITGPFQCGLDFKKVSV
ncbi:MAG: hypothetical protein KDA70_08690 [Planctomycetaceae bacterium]|nr:hypothetical protein [Planctomycetaceae bacterium]